ncbi:MAG: succinate dehydrogenase, cytochrome b556 subunit [Gammaproteobacteria bacterium WSBS_2016_MAG_OTU1]
MKYHRPKHLNLLVIRLPLPGILSIFHRVSGVILLLALPFMLAALQCSIASQEGYDAVVDFAAHPLVKLCIWGAAWALFHHLCAGIRFLLLDIHIGVNLEAARLSAIISFVVSILMTLIFGVWLW